MGKICLLIAIVCSTVVVSAAGYFRNSILGIDLVSNNTGGIGIVIQTRSAYDGNVSIVKRDAKTYSITLPEIDYRAKNPDLSGFSGGIQSFDVSTMPYNQNGIGYTKITVKTNGNTNISLQKDIYIPEPPQPQEKQVEETNKIDNSSNYDNPPPAARQREDYRRERIVQHDTYEPKRAEEHQRISQKTEEEIKNTEIETEVKNIQDVETDKLEVDFLWIFLGITLVVLLSLFIFIRAKHKLDEISGEKISIDTNDEEEDNNSGSARKYGQIKKTIKTLDSKYPKNAVMTDLKGYSASSEIQPVRKKSTEDLNIVDIDELFNEQQGGGDVSDNAALEEFLAGYYHKDVKPVTVPESVAEEKPDFDEALYEKIINANYKFSKKDLSKMYKIMNVEINDSTIKNIKKYILSTPVKKTKNQIMEDFITSYTVQQGLKFEQEDIDALSKLVDVELTQDFINDLRTDPNRTKQMEIDILKPSELKKPSKMGILKVSQMLPDLSDVQAHPERYAEPEKEVFKADEGTMLKNIENVNFKPFYDGSQNFEVLNVFDEEKDENIIEIKKDVRPAQEPEEKQRPEIKQHKKIIETPENKAENKDTQGIKCLYDGESYNVLSSIALAKDLGCHLVQNARGYAIFGYNGDKLNLIKTLGDINTTKIHAKLSETLDDGTLRFIIRIGTLKFVTEIRNNCVNYVMDL